MNTFDPNDPKWTAYLLNELSEHETLQCEQELKDHPEAKRYVEELADSAESLSASLTKEPDLSLNDLQRVNVMSSIQEKRKNKGAGLLVWPIAASFALLLTGVFFTPEGQNLLGGASEKLGGDGSEDMSSADIMPGMGDDSIYRGSGRSGKEHAEIVGVPELTKRSSRPELAPRKLEMKVKAGELVTEKPAQAPRPSVADTKRTFSGLGTSGFGTGVGGGYGTGMGGGMGGVPYRSREEIQRLRFSRPAMYQETNQNEFTSSPENTFKAVSEHPLSTFSIDVDTASYSVVRKFLKQGSLPPPDAVRVEEMINYFTYDYAPPTDGNAFAAHMDIAPCPWQPEHHLARIALKGREMTAEQRPPLNLVYLLDVSGSMRHPNKLPLVKRSLQALVTQLDERDRVAIVVYAGAAGIVLDSTSGADDKAILHAIQNLSAGGSTAGGAGIQLAYKTARSQFVEDGVNRVILCTDGDFNVGISDTRELENLIAKEAKDGIELTALGFGIGNYKDHKLETLSNRGNGNYAYIDDFNEARKVLVDQMVGTMITIAKDVKIQVEFNPAFIAGYRLIGYENRMLKKEDFNNDKVDAGEIGAGHTVTAFYELIPAGKNVPGSPEVDPLKYQPNKAAEPLPASNELLTLKLRHKQPAGSVSTKQEFPLPAAYLLRKDAQDSDYSFAVSVASFGLWLRDPEIREHHDLKQILNQAIEHKGKDPFGYRAEFIQLIRTADTLPKFP